jgi:SPP1 gp7 family putative phage head morphogenesis protein
VLDEKAKKIFEDLNNGLFDAQVKSLTNTTTLQATSVAKQEVYKENDIPKVVWTSELDSDVCEDCSALHGTEWPVDEAEIPPEHWNCRCELVPVDE